MPRAEPITLAVRALKIDVGHVDVHSIDIYIHRSPGKLTPCPSPVLIGNFEKLVSESQYPLVVRPTTLDETKERNFKGEEVYRSS